MFFVDVKYNRCVTFNISVPIRRLKAWRCIRHNMNSTAWVLFLVHSPKQCDADWGWNINKISWHRCLDLEELWRPKQFDSGLTNQLEKQDSFASVFTSDYESVHSFLHGLSRPHFTFRSSLHPKIQQCWEHMVHWLLQVKVVYTFHRNLGSNSHCPPVYDSRCVENDRSCLKMVLQYFEWIRKHRDFRFN